MPRETQTAATREKENGRLEAFSDGVFAIAITLLALELKVPHFDASGDMRARLISGLANQWPSYFAFLTSFFTVLIMWIHHHAMFRLVKGVDATLLFANGFLLMLVTVVPFPTAVVAEYLRTPAAPAACTLYAGFFVLIGIAFMVLLWAAFRPSVVDPDANHATIARLRKSYRLGSLAVDGNLHRAVDRVGRDYARVLTASRTPICRRHRSIHCLVSFSCTPFCDSRVRRFAQST